MTKPILLIVDDVVSNIQILARLLKDDYTIKVALGGKRALELVHLEPLPDLILLDVQMPDINGYDVLKIVKSSAETKNIPVIFVTGNDHVDEEIKGLNAGAVDYITKPIRPVIVKARVRTHITLKEQRDSLMFVALHDQLTGLYNRHHLNDEGAKMFAQSKRHGKKMSVIMADIDHFKSINDNHGHQVGDVVLAQVAELISKDNRVEDFSARFGGEEFIVVMQDCTLEYAKLKAETIRINIENANPNGILITSSFGIAQLNDSHANFEALLSDADKALYEAKESGRNRAIIYGDVKF